MVVNGDCPAVQLVSGTAAVSTDQRAQRFGGIVVRMRIGDHAPPHFHVTYAGDEIQMSIRDRPNQPGLGGGYVGA